MRLSQILFPTLKEIPKDAVVKNHILMLRAGIIRKLAAGIYSYLPLGLRSFKKVENIIREEMNQNGAQEFSLPILTPSELWQQSGRWEQFGPELMRIKDRGENMFALGPTHEEVFTSIVRNEIFSYKQLPVIFYQIKTKFRDEIRPRFGVMRCREFTMKDAYSFDIIEKDLDASYEKMRQTYVNIFKRCGLKIKIVAADSGAMGGSDSEEFMVESGIGEDSIVSCTDCSYASNMEKATADYRYIKNVSAPAPLSEVDTPACKTIEALTVFLGQKPEIFIKTLIYKTEKYFVCVLIRGDLEINEKKLASALQTPYLELAAPQDVVRITNAPVGFAGPVGLKDIRIIADESVKYITNGITGANKKDKHYLNANNERDYKVEAFFDVRFVKDNDICIKCGQPVRITKGIEVGHIFKLGNKYTKSMGVSVLDTDGKAIVPTMGCYGIGVDRTLAAAIEQFNDDNGIIFPISIAPYEIIITPVDYSDPEQKKTADNLYLGLKKAGIDILLDDRNERAGVKFKDADLIGIPIRVNIGPKFLKDNKLEIKLRKTGEVIIKDIPEAIDSLIKLKNKMMEEFCV